MTSTAVHAVAPHTEHKLARSFAARHDVVKRWAQQCATARDYAKPLVWFHAPSVGEGLQARPVIELLRAARPDVQIAYSFFSPSAEKFARSLNVDMAEFLPFDSASAAAQLMDVLKPSVLIFSKLDVWPNLVAVAHARGVRTGLLSGTVAPQSGRRGGLVGAMLHDAYATLDVAGAIDGANAERLIALGTRRERTSVSGDTRFDQVWARAANVNRGSDLLRALHSSRPTLVAGSTWPADEAVLLPAWLKVRSQVPDARLIIAPHEPTATHMTPTREWAERYGLNACLLAEILERATPSHADADVVIIDRVGVLGDIYAIADAAFVGGAFHRAGLHSVLEPAAYGAPVVFGPLHQMSREAGLLIAAGGAASVETIDECAMALATVLRDENTRSERGRNARAFVESELGAAERSLQLVLRALDRRDP